MPRHLKPWTQKADDILRQAVLDGWSLPKICQQHGRTEAAVRARVYVLGQSFRMVRAKSRGVPK